MDNRKRHLMRVIIKTCSDVFFLRINAKVKGISLHRLGEVPVSPHLLKHMIQPTCESFMTKNRALCVSLCIFILHQTLEPRQAFKNPNK